MNVLDHIGNTPLVQLTGVGSSLPAGVELWAKCEWFNPGGSVKDRAAWQMIKDARERGDLPAGKHIIEATSGNTGIALAMIGAVLGIPVTLVMPENVSAARKSAVGAFGADLVFSDPMEGGTDGAIRMCDAIVAEDPEKWYRPDQYGNPSNVRAHVRTTGPEILRQTRGAVTHFVAGIGTSGTVMGTSRFLRMRKPAVRCYAAEPAEALHGLEGWKHMSSAIVPALWKPDELDGVISVPTELGWDMAETVRREDHLFIGHGGGAAVWAAHHLALELKPPAVVVTVLPEGGERYL